MTTYEGHLRQRYDTTANWTAENPILKSGEEAWEITADDPPRLLSKVGNGSSAWNDLPYAIDFYGEGQILDSDSVKVDTTTTPGSIAWIAKRHETLVFPFQGGSVVPTLNWGIQRPAGLFVSEVIGVQLVAQDAQGQQVSDSCVVTFSRVDTSDTAETLGTVTLTTAKQITVTDLSGWSETALASGDTVRAQLTTTTGTATCVVACMWTREVVA